jgi:dihydropteroate synthase
MLSLVDLRALADKFEDCLSLKVQEFDIQGHPFKFQSSSYLMGVINLSADSWYRESVCLTADQAIQRGRRLAMEGASIVDIGAETTILEGKRVNESEQKKRLVPVIEELTRQKLLVSTETYHPNVTEACLNAGAGILNLTGNANAKDIFHMVAQKNAAVILCYVQGDNVRDVSEISLDEDMIPKLQDYFARKIEEATNAGVRRIFIDPGLGFYYHNLKDSALRVRYQMKIFLNTFRLRKLGWPVCHALPHAFEYFEDEVRNAEPFFASLALLGKTDLLRTHEISKVRAICKTMNVW